MFDNAYKTKLVDNNGVLGKKIFCLKGIIFHHVTMVTAAILKKKDIL